jgi:putative DNA primase/helicase
MRRVVTMTALPHISIQPNSSAPLQVSPRGIPDELKLRHQWVNWEAVRKSDGRLDKIPYTPGTSRKASSTDLMTWGTFEEAFEGLDRFDGVGFVFCSADPYVGVDLDNCVNPETGEVALWARQIIEGLDSYTELSPSGTGVHIIAKGRIPHSGRRGSVEMYSQDRFLTVTGRVLGDPA